MDLFFALSSFLITSLLLKEQEAEGGIGIRGFYLRRLLRIWPLYFVFMLAIRPLVPLFFPEESMSWGMNLAFLLFVGNLASAIFGFPHSVAAILWSVSMEEQFYLAWPLIVKRWTSRLMTVAVAMIVIAFVTRIVLVAMGAEHHGMWANTLARLDPIACGMILAVVAKRREIALTPLKRLALLAFGAGILLLIGRYGSSVGVKALATMPAGTIACTAIILATLGMPLPGLDKNPILRALVYLGRISYGLYVFHMVFVMSLHVAEVGDPLRRATLMIAALAGTTVCAMISYHLLERPFLKLKDRFAHIKSTPVKV